MMQGSECDGLGGVEIVFPVAGQGHTGSSEVGVGSRVFLGRRQEEEARQKKQARRADEEQDERAGPVLGTYLVMSAVSCRRRRESKG